MSEIKKATSERNFGMSTLIDDLIFLSSQNQEIDGKWYIAKPYDLRSFKQRLMDAYRVFIGKSQAYHFKEDEIE